MSGNDGTGFEARSAEWARRHYRGVARLRVYVSPPAAKQPYEVDIWVNIPTFLSSHDIWIECRDRKERVKAADVRDLVAKGTDVVRACTSGKQDFYFDRLVMASTSAFHDGALKVADAEGVECFEYNGRLYVLRNSRDISFNELWLRNARYSTW